MKPGGKERQKAATFAVAASGHCPRQSRFHKERSAGRPGPQRVRTRSDCAKTYVVFGSSRLLRAGTARAPGAVSRCTRSRGGGMALMWCNCFGSPSYGVGRYVGTAPIVFAAWLWKSRPPRRFQAAEGSRPAASMLSIAWPNPHKTGHKNPVQNCAKNVHSRLYRRA